MYIPTVIGGTFEIGGSGDVIKGWGSIGGDGDAIGGSVYPDGWISYEERSG